MSTQAERDALDEERERRRLAYQEQIRQPKREYQGSDATRGRLAKNQIRATLAAAKHRRGTSTEESQ